MKYFLDFEATQFSHRIISIGAVCENGHSFYSLVKPESKYKISKKINRKILNKKIIVINKNIYNVKKLKNIIKLIDNRING